jgi:hypothetical protein
LMRIPYLPLKIIIVPSLPLKEIAIGIDRLVNLITILN